MSGPLGNEVRAATLGKKVHLVCGGFPAGEAAGHDMDYARLRILEMLLRDGGVSFTSVSPDFTNLQQYLRNASLLVTYCAGPVPDDQQTAALKSWLEAGGRWLSLHGSSGGKAAKARPDEENVASSCSFLSNSYAGIIGSRHFGRSVPSESGLYVRTSRVCIDELGMSYSPEEPPAALTGKKGARCAAIATLLADLHDVYTRWDVTKQEMKALLPHARKVVEGVCPQLARRRAAVF